MFVHTMQKSLDLNLGLQSIICDYAPDEVCNITNFQIHLLLFIVIENFELSKDIRGLHFFSFFSVGLGTRHGGCWILRYTLSP